MPISLHRFLKSQRRTSFTSSPPIRSLAEFSTKSTPLLRSSICHLLPCSFSFRSMSSWRWTVEEDDDDGWDLHAVVRSCRPTNSLAAVPPPPATVPPRSQLPRSKKRKNQQKRRVCQVLADGVSGDLWSWRKYGQKPIKGSPFPRGYYRCSSSKGCLARKQVERSRTDEGMFVITYTGEHNHPLPTHRNSLAGSTRQKILEPSTTSTGEGGVRLSPNTPLTAGMEDELLRPRKKKKKNEKDEDLDMLLVEDMEVCRDDEVLFTGFEELQSSSLPAVDGIFDWDDESRRTGTLLWWPAGDC